MSTSKGVRLCTYMLIYQHDCNILPLLRERLERALDGGSFGFGVDDEVVLLRVWGVGYVLLSFREDVSLWF